VKNILNAIKSGLDITQEKIGEGGYIIETIQNEM
jgi:hypothetical protein